MCTLIPLSLLADYTYVRSSPAFAVRWPSYIFALFCGLIAGSLCVFIDFFFIYTSELVYDNMLLVALRFLWFNLVLPTVLVYAVFSLLFRDTQRFKAALFYPLMGGFYSLYAVHLILSSPVLHSFFALFVMPVLFVSLLACQAASIRALARLSGRQGMYRYCMAFFSILMLIASPVFISVIYGIYMTAHRELTVMMLTIIFTAVCFVWILFSLTLRSKSRQ